MWARAFAQEVSNDSGFPLFSPQGKSEERQFAEQLEEKLLEEIKTKGSSKKETKL